MRIAIVDSYYPAFLSTLTIGSGSYQEELDKVLARQFGTSDFYSREFRKLGHESIDIIANYGPLQTLWKRENRIHPNTNPVQTAVKQIAAFKPDVVFLQDLSLFDATTLNMLKEKSYLVAQCSCALPTSDKVKPIQTIFTSFPHYIPKLEALGVNAVYMPLAFHESVLNETVPMHNEAGEVIGDIFRHKTDVIERDIDVSFVGGIGWQWKQGLEVLETVAGEIPTFQWYGYGYEQLKPTSPLRPCYHGQAWGDRMYEIYQRSKIVINRHGEIAEGYANNMRMYEATGCGALLLTDNRTELFEVDEVAYYLTPENAVTQILFLLNSDYRQVRAINGHRRTLFEHTYAQRVPKIVEVLEKALVAA